MAYFPIIATTLPGGSPACGSPLSACFTNGSFTIAGNHLDPFTAPVEFIAYDDASPSSLIYPDAYDNGSPSQLRFIVQESTFDGTNTIIVPTTPIEAIADTYVQIVDSPYMVQYSDYNNKTPIVIPALESDSSTSLILPARAILDFGEIIDTNFLHLLETFAGPNAPAGLGSPQQNAPVEGQQWYDTSGSPPLNLLKVWNETAQEWETFQGAGILEEYMLGSAAGSPATTLTPTNVTVRPRLGGRAYQQVFLNGVLQREDDSVFTLSGNYYVTAIGGDIVFSAALLSDDEVLIYEL